MTGKHERVDTSHLDGVDDGCGCAEVWEHLSEDRETTAESRRDGDADAEADTDTGKRTTTADPEGS